MMKAKKVMAMCLASTMLAGLFGETAISVSADDKLKVALVLPGKKDDVSFNQSIYEGVENFVANRKDIDLQVVENVYEVSDITPTLTEFADSGYDVVIGHGYQFTDPMIEVGAKYPDVNFLGGCTVKQSENVGSYDVHLEAGGYLMGVVAALATETNKIGVIGGGQGSEITRGHEGFKAGAKSVNPTIEIQEVFTGDWNDTSGAYEAAISMYDSGVDCIWHSGDGIGLGVVQAAAKKDKYVLGNVEEQTSLAPEQVLSGIQYRWDKPIEQMFKDIQDGSFRKKIGADKVYWITVSNSGLEMVPLNDTKGTISDEDKQVIDDTLKKLQNNEITLPGDTSSSTVDSAEVTESSAS